MSEGYSDDDVPPRVRLFKIGEVSSRSISDEGLDNWPVVYIISGKDGTKRAYVGESSDMAQRIETHIKSNNGIIKKYKKYVETVVVIHDDRFNKSATLDLEQNLIRLLASEYEMLNSNLGTSPEHEYYQREIYSRLLDVIWGRLIDEHIVSNSKAEAMNSHLYKLSPFISLNDKQREIADSTVNNAYQFLAKYHQGKRPKKHMTVIEGGAGTGKSVLAVHILRLLKSSANDIVNPAILKNGEINELMDAYEIEEPINKTGSLKVGIVIPMTSFRSTVADVFRNTADLQVNMVIGPSAAAKVKDGYDVLIVDESHRLSRKKNLYNNKSFIETCTRIAEDLDKDPEEMDQLDWIIYGSKYQILFYDKDQTVRTSDIPGSSFDELVYGSNGSKKSKKSKEPIIPVYTLTQQERCKVDSEYINYVKSVLRPKEDTTITPMQFPGYSIGVFDKFSPMFKLIKNLDAEPERGERNAWGCCRIVSGFGWRWNSRKIENDEDDEFIDDDLSTEETISRKKRVPIDENDLTEEEEAQGYDIKIENKLYKWNSTRDQWPLRKGTLDEIGCIHTVQGYDLNYVGVIFGPEIYYDKDSGTIQVNPDRFYDTKAKTGTELSQVKEYILNAYFVLMTRGIYGCFIYAVNKDLREYLAEYFGKTDYNSMLRQTRENEKQVCTDNMPGQSPHH